MIRFRLEHGEGAEGSQSTWVWRERGLQVSAGLRLTSDQMMRDMVHDGGTICARHRRVFPYLPMSGSIFLAAAMSASAPALSPICSLATPRPYKAAANFGSSVTA
jgi:hypothetical protein